MLVVQVPLLALSLFCCHLCFLSVFLCLLERVEQLRHIFHIRLLMMYPHVSISICIASMRTENDRGRHEHVTALRWRVRTMKPTPANTCSSDSRLFLQGHTSHVTRHEQDVVALRGNAHSAHDAVGIIDMILYELGLLVYARETLRALGDRLANHLRLVNQRGHSALCRAQPDK